MRIKIRLLALFISCVQLAGAQYRISGSVRDTHGKPLEGVSITLQNTYYGATTNKEGLFVFQYPDSGKAVLALTLLGYKPVEKELIISTAMTPVIVSMKEEIRELEAVMLNAGVFEASDKKRSTVFKSVDIVTIAGEQADLASSLRTLPGAQQVGDQEGLFIRGGTGAETKVFIDGILVNNPFYSSVPGIAQRTRFSPMLFKGTVFSSGGYSAQYGQGLSSVLLLESLDLPSRSEANFIVSSPQLSFMGQRLNKKKTGSAGISLHYLNLQPYFSVVKQKVDYTKPPESLSGEFHSRQKMKNGMLKFSTYLFTNVIGFNRPGLDHAHSIETFRLKNRSMFSSAVYNGRFGNAWHLYAGLGYSYNKDDIRQQALKNALPLWTFLPQLKNRTLQSRVTVTKQIAGLSKLYFGMEHQYMQDAVFAKDSIPDIQLKDNYTAAYAEADIYYTANLVSRVGVRLEHSSLLQETAISPRLSLAYKFSDKSQISFACGQYYQKPEAIYLFREKDLSFTKAVHFILNYQRVVNGRTFRTEIFQKNYGSLLRYPSGNPFLVTNTGSGYARGLELFWRDKKSMKHLDYWISYSFLDTKRQFLDYVKSVQPSFVAKHTTTMVAKYFSDKLSTQFSFTYSYASGRPYFNPSQTANGFMSDRTIDYHNTGFQINYLRTFNKTNAVFILNINNVLGNKQVFGYRFSNENTNGFFAREAITPMARRFIFIGMYLSIGADRRKDILD